MSLSLCVLDICGPTPWFARAPCGPYWPILDIAVGVYFVGDEIIS